MDEESAPKDAKGQAADSVLSMVASDIVHAALLICSAVPAGEEYPGGFVAAELRGEEEGVDRVVPATEREIHALIEDMDVKIAELDDTERGYRIR